MPDPLLIRAARRILGLMGACAPDWRADDLRREWLGELHAHVARLSAAGRLTRAAQLALFLRCCGALFFVIWSWKHEWSLDMVTQDVRYGLRMLRRRPAFSAVAVVTLALGVGATTAIFSVVYGILLKPLPYPSPERLVKLLGLDLRSETRRIGNLSVPDVVDFQRLASSLEALGAHNYGGYFTLTGRGDTERVPRLLVTSGYFRALGVRPAMGRLFTADEDRPSPPDVIVVSAGFWQRRFGGEAGIIGATVTLNGNPATIVGVLPSGFVHPDPAIAAPPDIFALLDPDPDMSGRGGRYVRAIARLAPGATLERAEAELQSIASSLSELHPDSNHKRSVVVRPLAREVAGDMRAPLLLLQSAACAVLLIVCANLANLLLAAGTGRAGELAVRTALGASRARIVRQLLTEAMVLSASGGAIGIALAFAATRLLSGATLLPHMHRDNLAVDPVVLVVALLVSVGCGLVFGLLPALHIAGAAGPRARASSRHTESPLGSRLRFGLITAEVGVSVVLLVASLLLIRSFWQLTGVDPGFNRRGLLSFDIAVSLAKYPEGTQIAFYDRLYERLRALPGVESLGAVNILPLSGSYSCDGFHIATRPVPEGQEPCAEVRSASPDYFATMGIRLIKGRLLTDRDNESSRRVVVINEALAREFFPVEDPVGRQLVYSSRRQNDAREIVGVVGDVHHFGMQTEPRPEFYVPQRQPPSYHGMTIVLRTTGRPSDLVPHIRTAARELEPDAPLYNVRTIEELLGRSVSEERLRTLLLSSFAALALLLAVIGTYGVLSIAVAHRTQEMGIRLALGADRSDVVRLVVGQGLRPILAGAVLGLAVSFLVSRALTVFLFRVSTADPLTFAVVPLLIAAAGILAVWIPARRACRVDPASVLRPQ
jgi:putative ABC transport system permease protein